MNSQFLVFFLPKWFIQPLLGPSGFCALAEPWESFIIGIVGSVVSLGGIELLNKLKIDDPVGMTFD